MPHKDREARLAYLRAWKLRHRPAPTVEPQADPSLPARGRMTFSTSGAEVQCHSCGCWFGALNTHLKSHGLDARSYKELFGLPRTASLLPPATVERYRDAALARDQGAVGRKYIPKGSTRPKGLEPRLGVKIQSSEQRQGVYTRGGETVASTLPIETPQVTSLQISKVIIDQTDASLPLKKKYQWTSERRIAQSVRGRNQISSFNSSPEIIEKRRKSTSASLKERWKDPFFREKVIGGRKFSAKSIRTVQIEELYTQGLKQSEIAKKLGITRQAVHQTVARIMRKRQE